MLNLAELVDPQALESERTRLLQDAEDLRWAASWLADNGKDPETIAIVIAGSEIAERRAAMIP